MKFTAYSLFVLLGFVFLSTPNEANSLEYPSFFSFRPGTAWIFKTSNNQFERREVMALRNVEVPALSRSVLFVEIAVSRGKTENLLPTPSSVRSLYYLPTARGVLMSPNLGEKAQEFWPNSFLLFPEPIPQRDFSWPGWVAGTQCTFRFHGLTSVVVPLGRFEKCAQISYQSMTEGIGRGEIYFCPQIGETKFVEEDATLEIVRFIPSAKKSLDVVALSPQETEAIWSLLPGTDLLTSKFHDKRFEGQGVRGQQVVFLLAAAAFLAVLWFFYRYFRRIKALDVPVNREILEKAITLSSQEMEAGNLNQAQRRLEELLTTFPNYADLHYRLGLVHERSQNLEHAILSIEYAVRINPKYVDAHMHLGSLYQKKEKWQEALRSFRVVLQAHPDYPDIHNLIGEILDKMGLKDEARSHFEQALAINPHFVEARKNLQGQ